MRHLRTGAIVAVLAVAAAACSSGSGSTGNTTGGKLTVWLMNGSAPPALVDSLKSQFQASHAGVTVDVQIQEWTGIQDKLTTALSSKSAPDVIELGNTQAPRFTQQGVLADLGDVKDSKLNGAKWLDALAKTGQWDGNTYATPFYAANRVVAYRSDLFAKAGLKPPTTIDEWVSTGQQLAAANKSTPGFQALYLPGQNWFILDSLIWARGGELATRDGDNWKGALDSAQSRAAVNDYATLFHKLSKAQPDVTEAQPPQADIFAKGNVGMMVILPWEIASIEKANPKLKGKIGAFPIPGSSGPAPVFLGGSNLAVPALAQHKDLAEDFLGLMLGNEFQRSMAETNAVVPGITGLGDTSKGDPIVSVMVRAAATSNVTPPDPRWAAVEAGPNPINDMLTAVITGTKSLDDATADASSAITKLMSVPL